ncbi:DUF1415 domain-containing protein [Luteimonas sp. FXH3W]|uniref:DUF1415 domain-containing protein n=1 Tax=Aquilutibacter rugosus TaxID=3115820 RepID=A0ABU7UYJ9_9GAMM
MTHPDEDEVLARTRQWIERAVIGLNLCPFAKAVYVKQQVRLIVSDATTETALLAQLGEELSLLRDTPPDQIDTTLIVHPQVLQSFLDYNDFLDLADGLVSEMGLEGDIQVASFHPDYQFADTDPDDVGNNTNRSPYPTLHLLREASIDRAVAAYPDPSLLFERNIEIVEELGADGWDRLMNSESH